MEVFPATAALMLIWLVACLRDPDNSVLLAVAFVPFGMFAAVVLPSIGNLSLIAASVLAMLAVGLTILRHLSPNHTGTVERNTTDIATFFYAAFTAYAVFSAIVLVRVFEGDFLVFPMSRGVEGVQVDVRFPSIMAPVGPSASNLSQTMYLVLSFVFFLVCHGLFRRRGYNLGDTAIRLAAMINILLGILDFFRLDSILAFVRTSTYSLANLHSIGSFDRIIGGFPEPSSFGAVSAAFFAYFTSAFLYSRRGQDAGLALASGLLVLLSFSASGYIAAGAFLILLVWRARRLLYGQFDGHVFTAALGLGALIIAGVLAAVLFMPANGTIPFVIDALFVSKFESVSGLERGAWARSGFDAFNATWWLGAGVGSLRSNGLLPVILGSVGLPGAILLLGFLFGAFAGRAPSSNEGRTAFFAAQAGAVALLGAAFVSATGPDLGLLVVTFAGIASLAKLEDRQNAQRENRDAHYQHAAFIDTTLS